MQLSSEPGGRSGWRRTEQNREQSVSPHIQSLMVAVLQCAQHVRHRLIHRFLFDREKKKIIKQRKQQKHRKTAFNTDNNPSNETTKVSKVTPRNRKTDQHATMSRDAFPSREPSQIPFFVSLSNNYKKIYNKTRNLQKLNFCSRQTNQIKGFGRKRKPHHIIITARDHAHNPAANPQDDAHTHAHTHTHTHTSKSCNEHTRKLTHAHILCQTKVLALINVGREHLHSTCVVPYTLHTPSVPKTTNRQSRQNSYSSTITADSVIFGGGSRTVSCRSAPVDVGPPVKHIQ